MSLSVCPTVVCFPRIGFTIETRFDTGKTNLELIFCRRVSFRSVSVGPRRYLLLSLAVFLSVFGMAHGTGGGAKVGGSCLVFLRLFPAGFARYSVRGGVGMCVSMCF